LKFSRRFGTCKAAVCFSLPSSPAAAPSYSSAAAPSSSSAAAPSSSLAQVQSSTSSREGIKTKDLYYNNFFLIQLLNLLNSFMKLVFSLVFSMLSLRIPKLSFWLKEPTD